MRAYMIAKTRQERMVAQLAEANFFSAPRTHLSVTRPDLFDVGPIQLQLSPCSKLGRLFSYAVGISAAVGETLSLVDGT